MGTLVLLVVLGIVWLALPENIRRVIGLIVGLILILGLVISWFELSGEDKGAVVLFIVVLLLIFSSTDISSSGVDDSNEAIFFWCSSYVENASHEESLEAGLKRHFGGGFDRIGDDGKIYRGDVEIGYVNDRDGNVCGYGLAGCEYKIGRVDRDGRFHEGKDA